MSVTILVPTALRSFVDRQSEIAVTGSTVGEAIGSLVATYPDLKRQIYADETNLRGFINVFLDGANIKKLDGLATPVKDGNTIMLVPAIAGGSKEL